MQSYEDKVFTLDNGENYIIIELAAIESKQYAYIVNIEDEMDTAFIEIISSDSDMFFKQTYDQSIIKKILENVT